MLVAVLAVPAEPAAAAVPPPPLPGRLLLRDEGPEVRPDADAALVGVTLRPPMLGSGDTVMLQVGERHATSIGGGCRAHGCLHHVLLQSAGAAATSLCSGPPPLGHTHPLSASSSVWMLMRGRVAGIASDDVLLLVGRAMGMTSPMCVMGGSAGAAYSEPPGSSLSYEPW